MRNIISVGCQWNKEWFSARDLINSALVFLPNQPDMIKLRQFVEGKITEMGWFKRNWQRNKIAMISLGNYPPPHHHCRGNPCHQKDTPKSSST